MTIDKKLLTLFSVITVLAIMFLTSILYVAKIKSSPKMCPVVLNMTPGEVEQCMGDDYIKTTITGANGEVWQYKKPPYTLLFKYGTLKMIVPTSKVESITGTPINEPAPSSFENKSCVISKGMTKSEVIECWGGDYRVVMNAMGNELWEFPHNRIIGFQNGRVSMFQDLSFGK